MDGEDNLIKVATAHILINMINITTNEFVSDMGT